MTKKDIKFDKYQKRGNYHWQQIGPSIFKHNAFVSARYNQVVDLIPQNSSLKILDIGSGDGVLSWLIYKKTKSQVTGIDTDKLSLKLAKNKFKQLEIKAKFKKANAYKLPFKKNSFDLVVSAEVIEHLSNTKKYLSEITRVLKPKGKAIITTPIKLSEIPEDKMHVKEFDPTELKNLLESHFKVVSIKTSHPLALKKLYLLRLFKTGRFHFEPLRWLINIFVLTTKINPFKLGLGQSTNQVAICRKLL